MSDDVNNSVKNIVKRAYVQTLDNAAPYQLAMVSYQGRNNVPVESFSPYGLFANPPPGAQGVIFNIGGREENRVGMFSMITHRPQGNESGVVWLYNSVRGSSVRLLDNGNVQVVTPNNYVVDIAENGIITGNGNFDIDVTGNLKAKAGGTATVEAPTIYLKGNVIVDGTLTANNGQITMSGGNFSTSGDVIAGTISLKNHIHGGVAAGGANTDPPTP